MKINNFIHKSKQLWEANHFFVRHVSIHYWPLYLLQFSSIIISGFSASIVSKISQSFIDQIIIFSNFQKAMQLIFFWMAYTVIMHLLQHFTSVYSNYAYAKTHIFIKEKIAVFLSSLNMSFYDVPENKNVLARAIKYSETGGPQLLNYFFSLTTNVVAILSLLYVLTPFSWWIIIFLVVLTVYKATIETIVAKKNYSFQKEKTLLNRKVSYFSSILLNANYILDINIYNAFDFFFGKFKSLQDESIHLNTNHSIKVNLFSVLATLSIVVQHVILYAYIGNELLCGRVTVADFTLFFTAVNYFNAVLSNFRKSFSSYVPMTLEAQNYIEFLKTSNLYKYTNESREKIWIEHINSIEFKNVYFKYTEKSEYVIKNISFCIAPGEMVSLVGQNGAGKTTLIKLILGLYRATEGQILINSHPIEDINIKSYWNSCSILFQQFNIYSMSAYENITFDSTNSICLDYILDQCGLSDFFSKKERGLKTELSRDFDSTGTNLSGGEKQKVAFARTYHYDRQFLILDEPSSALDAKSENELFDFAERVQSKDNNRITLFVSHKLSSSLRAGKIIVISNGNLVEIGNHEYLMNNCNEYKTMFTLQAEKYIEGTVANK